MSFNLVYHWIFILKDEILLNLHYSPTEDVNELLQYGRVISCIYFILAAMVCIHDPGDRDQRKLLHGWGFFSSFPWLSMPIYLPNTEP